MGSSTRSAPGRHGPLILAVAAALVVLTALPAAAHEGEETGSASVLVRQAIALIVNTPDDVEAIADKISDAGRAEDTEGVDLALVEEAGAAFAAGDSHQARALLERSIGAQPHITGVEPPPIRETTPDPRTPAPTADPEMPTAADPAPPPMTMATGAEPGMQLIADPLEVRPHLDGGDWALLAAALAVGFLGVWLGLRWRPAPRTAP